jgi:hypothetical protein
MEREPAVPLTRAALRSFVHWRTSRGGITKREAVEIAYDALVHQRDPLILTTATYTEWLSQGYEDYLVNGREGYIALGWGASPEEFSEQKRLAFLLPKDARTHT